MLALVKYFLYLGLTGFGGPLILIQQMRTHFAEKNKQMSNEEFDQAFALIKAMPGPVAFQMAPRELGRVESADQIWNRRTAPPPAAESTAHRGTRRPAKNGGRLWTVLTSSWLPSRPQSRRFQATASRFVTFGGPCYPDGSWSAKCRKPSTCSRPAARSSRWN